MKLSKKSRYGIAALIDLAIYQKEGRVALNNIAERNINNSFVIPISYFHPVS